MISNKLILTVSWIITAAIYLLVLASYYLPPMNYVETTPILKGLPTLNACLNLISTILIVLAVKAVKSGQIDKHRNLILSAFGSTALFLVAYLLYHFGAEPTPFGGQGIVKTIYYVLLIGHIFLAAIIVPLALVTVGYGLNNNIQKHRKLAKITFPLWLFVNISAVVVYVMAHLIW